MTLLSISQQLCAEVEQLRIDATPVACVYNPLDYAAEPHAQYLERYGAGPKHTLLVGMNPGPWGMLQTGVPFGDVTMVREFLGIEAVVRQPAHMHPKRPVEGFDCTRTEVSGSRLWGWAKARYGQPAQFFERFFVHNYCPLAFVEASGKNLTPDKLPASASNDLFAACDQALQDVVKLLKPKHVIGIGAFAEKRAHIALADFDIHIGRILHPSPASPLANTNWAQTVDMQLTNQLGQAF